MPYKIVKGDLLTADTEYVVQQNNCTAVKAHGLSETIAKQWSEVDPYKDRRKLQGNWSVAEDRPAPGTILVYEFEDSGTDTLKGVICAFAQYCHGKPGRYNDPLGLDTHDTPLDRLLYFKQCLASIALLKPKSVGFPYRIGCGLAGGSWIKYEQILKQWSAEHPEMDVVVYNNES